MKKSLYLVCAMCAGMFLTTASAAELRVERRKPVSFASLWTSFVNPPTAAKPWSYYFIQNTLTDKQTVSEEVADIHRLGFGGILITDSRGYWVDDDHLLLPNEEHVRWGSDEWLELMAHVVRTCAQNDIRIALNVAASGGHLRGEEDVKGDNPKYLAYKLYRPGEPFEKPASPYFRDIAAFTLKADGTPDFDGAWHGAGDGIFSTAASTSKRKDGQNAKRMPAVVAPDGNVVVRFGYDIMPGIPNDIDVLDRTAVRRHLDKVIGRLIARVPGLVGTDRTLAYCYNVSWEGMMPTWSATFAADYRRYAGYDLMPLLPELAGFDLKGAKPYAELMRDYRASRGKMMCNHMYGEVRRWAHEHGMDAISESGGPWPRQPQTFGEQDQLAFLAANDVPQGEFWPTVDNCSSDARHAVRYGRFIDRGPVYAARTYGRPIVSSESFTHMRHHYSVDPAFLKPLGDITFANGINRIVWHTYSTSPRRYGCPGIEYFAGSHINRNVTWTRELPAFVEYLGRCQVLLQWGRPVVDIAVKGGTKPYTGWGTRKNGFFRQKVSEEMDIAIPKGYEFDVVGDDALAQNPQLLARYRTVWPAKIDYAPDVETAADWLWTHRTDGRGTEVYFLVGEGDARLTFRAEGKSVEVWDAVTATRAAAQATPTADGRTTVDLSLPMGGSCFVVFSPEASDLKPRTALVERKMVVTGPWKVTFENHPFITSPVPASRTMTELLDWTTVPSSERKGAPSDLNYFAGTATYETTLDGNALKQNCEGRIVLSLGKVPSGIAHVYVNGTDCGTVWCEPWEVDVTKALAASEGSVTLAIRYTNNWYNRFVGDCFLPEGERVLKSNVRSWAKNRENVNLPWRAKPTVYSGFCQNDPLQPSGLLGPVSLVFQRDVSMTKKAANAMAPAPRVQERAEILWTKSICVETNRYIGWPSVCRLQNGEVWAVFSGDREAHVCPFGKVQMVRSRDGGETWSSAETIANGPIDDRDAGIVQMPDGEVVVTYFTSIAYRSKRFLETEWRPDQPQYWWKRHDEKISDDLRASALGYWRTSSRDNGRTWSKPEKIACDQTPHGPILLRDGSLFQIGRHFTESMQGAGEKGRTVITAWRSTDAGHTWECLCPNIPDMNGENRVNHMFHEPHAVELANGDLLALVRYHGSDGCMRETISRDGGRTWSPMAKTSLLGLPPHLINLPGGKTLCVFARRRKPGYGEYAVVSDDGGKNWDLANEILLAPGFSGDIGYPATCALANGDLLTVYYQAAKASERPSLMATRWRLRR